MSQLETVGLRAIEYTKALNFLRSAKYDLLDRMALFDKTHNDHARVTRDNPMYEQLEVFCFDQFKAKGIARNAVNNAKKRLVNAAIKHQKEAQ
jgi:hypothetical protein